MEGSNWWNAEIGCFVMAWVFQGIHSFYDDENSRNGHFCTIQQLRYLMGPLYWFVRAFLHVETCRYWLVYSWLSRIRGIGINFDGQFWQVCYSAKRAIPSEFVKCPKHHIGEAWNAPVFASSFIFFVWIFASNAPLIWILMHVEQRHSGLYVRESFYYSTLQVLGVLLLVVTSY